MNYALGKFAIAICDICGQRYKLHELKKQWNGWKACHECYDPKQPKSIQSLVFQR